MDIYKLIEKRFSVRSYTNQPVADDVVRRVLDAARMAPSAANRQPWFFIVVSERERLQAVQKAYPRSWLAQAPLIIVVCAKPGNAWIRSDGAPYFMMDMGIAMDHMILAATHEGLGTCWIGAFDAPQLRLALSLPPEIEPAIMTPLGYPAETEPPKKQRKAFEEIVRWNHW